MIEFYLQNGKNQALTCQHFQLEKTILRHWINQYNHSGIISQWLQAFDKQGINGLLPKPKGRPTMKPQYPQIPPPPKIEEERLCYRILEQEAEVALLKKLQEYKQEKMRKKQVS